MSGTRPHNPAEQDFPSPFPLVPLDFSQGNDLWRVGHPAGTIVGDLWRVRNPEGYDYSDAERLAALQRLVQALRLYIPRDSWAKQALGRLCMQRKQDVAGVLADVWPCAILLAYAERMSPQRIRLGSSYLKRDGKLDLSPAQDLSTRQLLKWLRKETIKEAQRLILEEAAEDETARLAREVGEGAEFCPYDEAEASNQHSEPVEDEGPAGRAGAPGLLDRELLEALDAAASPQQRELMEAFLDCGDWSEAARRRGIPPEQAHVQITRLRKKMRARVKD